MKFDAETVINELGRNLPVFDALFTSLPEGMIHWRPQPDKWNLLEVACHLLDEEREDFRSRLLHTLRHPDQAMPPIDPQGWVKDRNYAAREFEEVRENFARERKQSIVVLNSLSHANWESEYVHPKLGRMSAKLFLCNWLAHDYLHIRQILKLKHGYLAGATGESLDYAGPW